MNPVIVVSAYNRPNSLKRLLSSLDQANYESKDGKVKLIISIDFSGSDEVKNIANEFKWEHGQKELIIHQSNLGLKKHILSCGDLTNKYGSIILLEDDLFVSPYFYTYASEALLFYSGDPKIAGISLYKHMYNETAKLPFTPLKEDGDVFFMQLASSWGQAWTSDQWNEFKKWYNSNPRIDSDNNLPWDVKLWPESSWKKYYIKYLIVKDKFFVYPQTALSTNFGDAGTHQPKDINNLLQVPVSFLKRKFRFVKFSDSNCIYDVFCELLPNVFKKFSPKLKEYDFEVDLYRTKEIAFFANRYRLTTVSSEEYKKLSNNRVMAFGLHLKPMEVNVLMDVTGENIVLLKPNSQVNFKRRAHRLLLLEYFYKYLDKDFIKALIFKIWKYINFKVK